MLGIVIFYCVGVVLLFFGVNFLNVQQCIKEVSVGEVGQIYFLINLFFGGVLLKFMVFVVGVMFYIIVSIIVQLFIVVILRFEEFWKEGQVGQLKMIQYICYLVIVLVIF